MVIFTIALLVAPAQVSVQDTVLVLNLEARSGTEDTATLVDGYIATALSKKKGLQVASASDVVQMVQLETDKQLAGCDEESCLAEIADALDARYVVFGQLGTLGEAFVVQLNLYDARTAKTLARSNTRPTLARDLPGAVEDAVDELMEVLGFPPPTRNAQFLPGIAALSGGVILVGVGTIPAIWFYVLQGDIGTAQQDGARGQARAKQVDAKTANDIFNYVGIPVIVLGTILAISGVVILEME